MIEYEEWTYIPFYRPKDTFRIMNETDIQKKYYTKNFEAQTAEYKKKMQKAVDDSLKEKK